jgi:hypothetical protein
MTEKHLSPWQELVERTRITQDLSYRRLGEKAEIPHSTLYQWVNDEPGHPKQQVYPESVNKRLSRALNLEPRALMESWDQSAARFTLDLERKTRAGIEAAKDQVSGSSKSSYTKGQVLSILNQIS